MPPPTIPMSPASPDAEDLFGYGGLSVEAFPFSPLTCPSPAEWGREDFVRHNKRRVQDEYEFERVLGAGSFGKVHVARHRRLGTKRAIKEIVKKGTEAEDFEAELHALVALDHPHIVNLLEYFDDEDIWYLVMELCSGPDLFTYIIDHMDQGPDTYVPEKEASVILRQCLKAVLCCHANGFVHRDLNAKNFMITGADSTIKLIDFGLAKHFHSDATSDEFIEIVGTCHYMAPEMMLAGEYSPASDSWSLGVLLYVVLTGMMLLPKDNERKKLCLNKKTFVQRKLETCKVLQKRGVSAQARDMLERLLQHEAAQRITASASLSHPFVLTYCHDYLGPPFDEPVEFDFCLVDKLRSFGKSPRLRKIALLTMAHLADHEKALWQARHTFRTLDRDGDGVIALQEMREGLQRFGIEEPFDLQEVFTAVDSHRSGKLTFVEFVAGLLPGVLIDERLCYEAFNVLDQDCKGQISADDLQSVCHHYTLEKCERIVRQADPSGKGYFDFEDFHRFLRGDEAVDGQPPQRLQRLNSGGRLPQRRPSDSPTKHMQFAPPSPGFLASGPGSIGGSGGSGKPPSPAPVGAPSPPPASPNAAAVAAVAAE